MTVKEYLIQPFKLNNKIKAIMEQQEQLRALCLSLTSGNFGVGSGMRKSEAGFERIIEKIMGLEQKINHEIDSYIDIKKEIRTKICLLENATEQAVLINRYLNFMTFEQMAESMNYSTRQVYRIFQRAIKKMSLYVSI